MDILFNKYMIQNPVFCVKLSIVYAIVLWANFYVKFLMSSTKAAVNSFDECNVFEKAAQLSVIVYDNKLNDSNDEAFSINTVCNCRSRYDNFVYFNRPRTHGIRVRVRKSSRMHLFTNKAREKIYAHGVSCENKGRTKYPSSSVKRKYRKSNKHSILEMQNQYPHAIKSPQP